MTSVGLRPEKHVLALVAGRRATLLLLRVHARVGEPERCARIRRLLGQRDNPEGARDLEAVSALAQRRRCDPRELEPISLGEGDDAKLVAAHPVGRRSADRAIQRRPEPLQEHIAREMTEGVVVGLEPVEVEEHERRRLRHRLEVGDQLAAVREPRQRVGTSLDSAPGDHRQILSEDHGHPPEHRDQAGSGEREREEVDPGEVVVDEHCNRDDAEGRGEDEDVPCGRRSAPASRERRLLPAGERHHRGADHPAGVEDRSRLVGAIGDPEEVEAVRDPEDHDAEREQNPSSTELPAQERHRADDESVSARSPSG